MTPEQPPGTARFAFDLLAYFKAGGDWLGAHAWIRGIETSGYYDAGQITYYHMRFTTHFDAHTEEAELWLMLNLPPHTTRIG